MGVWTAEGVGDRKNHQRMKKNIVSTVRVKDVCHLMHGEDLEKCHKATCHACGLEHQASIHVNST